MFNEIISNLAVIGVLVFANAFFVAAEFALVRVRRTRIEELITAGNTTARVVKDAIEHLDDYISATQVGITLASLALGWVGESFLAHSIFEPLLAQILGPDTAFTGGHAFALGLSFFMITFMHVVLGELMPKSLALQYPEKMSLWIARPMRFCALVFRPLIWLLNGTSNRLLKLLGVQPASSHSLALSEEELLMLVSESKKAGVVSESEQKMLQQVFKFHNKTVREIMIPRPDVVMLDLKADEKEIKSAFKQGYSRLPVYQGDPSNIKGVVYVKDLIYTLQDPKLIKLVDLIREALYVPETQAVPKLLHDFQRSKVHMAIVVDEFGDTAGLVTLEDVIEEIVGEIQDEYDYEPAEVERAPDGSVIFDGKSGLDRFKEVFPDVELPDGSFETVAGLVFQLSGHVPKEAEVIRHVGLQLRVIKRDGRRLRKIAIKRDTPASSTPESAATVEKLPATGIEHVATVAAFHESVAHEIASDAAAAERKDGKPDPDDGELPPRDPRSRETGGTPRPSQPSASTRR